MPEAPQKTIADQILPPSVSQRPDAQDEAEEKFFASEAKKQDIKDRESYRKLREKYAARAYGFLVMWVLLVFAVVVLDGFKFLGFDVSDTVLSILVGSTTVSAVGLVSLVGQGLFRVRSEG